MTFLKDIEIEGYRGINKYTQTFKKINLFVGKNNAGKSSILEAIAIIASSSNGYLDTLGEDLLKNFAERKNWNLEYFINLELKKCLIKATINRTTVSLSIEYDKEGIPKGLSKRVLPLLEKIAIEYAESRMARRERFQSRTTRSEKEVESPLEYEDLIDQQMERLRSRPKLIISNSLTNRTDLLLEREEEVIVPTPKVISTPIMFSGTDCQHTLKDLHDTLLPTERFTKIIESVRSNIDYVRDVRTLEDQMYVFLKNAKKPIPIELMGDGFKEVLRIAFLSALSRNGLIFLEEPENNLHPGFLDVAIKYLVNSVKEFGTQVFISTHSLEFLKGIIAKAGEDIQIVRIYRANNEIDREIFDGKSALEELEEIELDLRGA